MQIEDNGDVLCAWSVILQISCEDWGAETRLCRVKERLLALRFHY
jgi:hypothetical protein